MAWIPMESNPEVLNRLIHNTGVKKSWKFIDVYSLDHDCLMFIEGPVIALVMLFPCDGKYDTFSSEQMGDILEKGQHISSNVFYMKQYISNACGAIALIHSVANNLDLDIVGDGDMKKFLDSAKNLNPVQRGELLMESEALAEQHNNSANEGQTKVPSPDVPVNYHFVSLVNVDGHIYELDGRKDFPINHGPTSNATFLIDAVDVCRFYMNREPDNLNFTVLALVPDNEALYD